MTNTFAGGQQQKRRCQEYVSPLSNCCQTRERSL